MSHYVRYRCVSLISHRIPCFQYQKAHTFLHSFVTCALSTGEVLTSRGKNGLLTSSCDFFFFYVLLKQLLFHPHCTCFYTCRTGSLVEIQSWLITVFAELSSCPLYFSFSFWKRTSKFFSDMENHCMDMAFALLAPFYSSATVPELGVFVWNKG